MVVNALIEMEIFYLFSVRYVHGTPPTCAAGLMPDQCLLGPASDGLQTPTPHALNLRIGATVRMPATRKTRHSNLPLEANLGAAGGLIRVKARPEGNGDVGWYGAPELGKPCRHRRRGTRCRPR